MKKHVKTITWVGVILMLIAMVIYVVTLDEAEIPVPGENVGEPTPVAE